MDLKFDESMGFCFLFTCWSNVIVVHPSVQIPLAVDGWRQPQTPAALSTAQHINHTQCGACLLRALMLWLRCAGWQIHATPGLINNLDRILLQNNNTPPSVDTFTLPPKNPTTRTHTHTHTNGRTVISELFKLRRRQESKYYRQEGISRWESFVKLTYWPKKTTYMR